MSQWERVRECRECQAEYRLADHGVAGARAVAESLDAGRLAEDDAPAVAWTCPTCLGTEQMEEHAATAEMFRLDHAASQAKRRQIPNDVKVAASGLVVIGGILLGGFLAFGAWQGFSQIYVVGALSGVLIVASGLGVGIGAALKARGPRRPRPNTDNDEPG